MQRSKTTGLHIKKTPENLTKIIGILVPAGHGDFVDVQRGEQEQVLRVFHSGAMNAFGGIAAVGLAVNTAEVIGVAMEFTGN